MCTCISLVNGDFYFGRNMDLSFHFDEKLVVAPRNYAWGWACEPPASRQYAVMGIAHLTPDGYPVYAEAVNEHGLCMAGLNFPGNAVYHPQKKGQRNVAPYELVPYILSQAKTVKEGRKILKGLNLLDKTDRSFLESISFPGFHFALADAGEFTVIEPREDGLHIYDNPARVLTNNPPFPCQLINLQNYANLSAETPANLRGGSGPKAYGAGLGAAGLPGDASPMSRFVSAHFFRRHSVSAQDENSNVAQMFHLLGKVEVIRGSVVADGDARAFGEYDLTTYSACINASQGRYYVRTYDNPVPQVLDLHQTDLDAAKLHAFDLIKEPEFLSLRR